MLCKCCHLDSCHTYYVYENEQQVTTAEKVESTARM